MWQENVCKFWHKCENWKLWHEADKLKRPQYFLSAYKSVLKWDLWDRRWYWYSSLPWTLTISWVSSFLALPGFKSLYMVKMREYRILSLNISFIMFGNPCKVFFSLREYKVKNILHLWNTIHQEHGMNPNSASKKQ